MKIEINIEDMVVLNQTDDKSNRSTSIEDFRVFAETIARSQEVLAEYLPPDGIDAKEVIDRLLGILDDKKLVLLQKKYADTWIWSK